MLTIVLLYAAFLGVGWLAGRKNPDRTPADFIVAGRAMPLWLATFTMTATWVDGGYLLGTAEGVYRSSIATGLQGGVCFGLSLILGGVLFAKRMRALGFTTLIDLFEARFGPAWAAVLSLPAMFAEMFWSAELLVALGSTFGVILGLDLVTAIAISAAVVTIYTMSGGMWAVAYTDALQLALVVIGLGIAAPIVLDAVGGLAQAWEVYRTTRPEAAMFVPPLTATSGLWTGPAIVSWWDVSVMLVLGGIPWNCYFQRVLSCRTPDAARAHSLIAGAPDDDPDDTAADAGPGGVGVSLARGARTAVVRAAGRRGAAAVSLRHAAAGRRPGPCRDYRRRHVELLVVHPVGERDVQLEHVHAAAEADAVRSRTCG